MGANCDQSLDTSQIHYDSSNNIVVETAVPFDKYLCIEASTKGKKIARSIIQFEVCGNSDISLQKKSSSTPDKITKYFSKAAFSTKSIKIVSEGYTFVSSSANCVVVSYRLM
jgi:hypothetical protein